MRLSQWKEIYTVSGLSKSQRFFVDSVKEELKEYHEGRTCRFIEGVWWFLVGLLRVPLVPIIVNTLVVLWV